MAMKGSPTGQGSPTGSADGCGKRNMRVKGKVRTQVVQQAGVNSSVIEVRVLCRQCRKGAPTGSERDHALQWTSGQYS